MIRQLASTCALLIALAGCAAPAVYYGAIDGAPCYGASDSEAQKRAGL
jgi:hypothetical protein